MLANPLVLGRGWGTWLAGDRDSRSKTQREKERSKSLPLSPYR